jgi:DNA (cytosine-5)-methyltransferase 1
MADGNSHAFNFPRPQVSRLRPGEIIVDLFAGGGGASEALKQALGIDPALAYNHDEMAIGMHAANHPLTIHHREDIWHADPVRDVAGRLVGWFHASPDCTHFSQAKGGQPRNGKIRALSWVIPKWIGMLARVGLAPRIVSMENVWQIRTWGPLVAKRCKKTGRVLKMDGTVAAKGERVPVEQQQLVPDKRHTGRTWRRFVAVLESFGYVGEARKLIASDYGAGTSRERLFGLWRRDGLPVVWPTPTHGRGDDLQPVVSAADCLDFSIPCPSIFTRKRPLADATLRRIAKGVTRHVLESADPFIVPATHQGSDRINDAREPLPTVTAANRGELMLVAPELAPFLTEHANASNQRTMPADEPLRTQCAGVKGGHFAMVSPVLAGVGGRAGQTEPRAGDDPLYTITTKGDTAVIAPTLVQTGYGERTGQAPRALDLDRPLGTVVAGGVKHAVSAAHMVTLRRNMVGSEARAPLHTIAAGAEHHAIAVAHLTAMAQNVVGTDLRDPCPTILAGATRFGTVCAFLEQANGGFFAGGGRDAREPVSTITSTGSQQQLVELGMVERRCASCGTCAPAPGCGDMCRDCFDNIEFDVGRGLTPEQQAGALRVAAFLIKYHGTGANVPRLEGPLSTISTKDRLALVTVTIHGTPYVIVDIGLRMLKPRELYRAQGFPSAYIIDRTADGRPISTTAAVRMVGNSVSPPPLCALAAANADPVAVLERLAA